MSDPMTVTVRCETPEATQTFGECVAAVLKGGDLVVLSGDLGAGKTTFVKGVVRALGGTITVTSPTFVLCHLYDTVPIVAHADCWRFDDPAEVIDLGLDEVLDDGGIALVEWGERAALPLEFHHARIDFSVVAANDDAPIGDDGSPIVARTARFSALGEAWPERIEELRAQVASRSNLVAEESASR